MNLSPQQFVPSTMPIETESHIPTFIPAKRRKIQQFRRRRSTSPSATIDNATGSTGPVAATGGIETSESADTPPVSTLLRLRRPHRRFGLEVSTPKPPTPTSQSAKAADSSSDAAKAAAEAEVLAVVNRFTHQTGQVTDVDKHMMAYVEAEMSKRRGEDPSTSNFLGPSDDIVRSGKSSYWAPTRPEARGATLGKLHEVDLGEEVKQRNIAMTKKALSSGGTTELADEAQPGKNKRNRRRRNSQDIERDRLVEEVLKETRLDLYPEVEEGQEDADEQGAADDKIAEKFRKEFIDAILSKRRRRGGDHKAKGHKKEDKKRPKGPKLGGSRMARAQMREQRLGAAVASGSGTRGSGASSGRTGRK